MLAVQTAAAQPDTAKAAKIVPPVNHALLLSQGPSFDVVEALKDQKPNENPGVTTQMVARIPECPFTRKMEWKGIAVSGEPGFWCWSAWPVQGDDGKYHLFGERWPKDADGCLIDSELRHYTSDKPEGPYTFVDVPLPRGKKGEFDCTQIYPCVQRNGKGWAMLYTGFNGIGRYETMRPGIALADSLNGPWRKVGMAFDVPRDPKHWMFGSNLGIHVSTFVQFHGKWFVYFKSGGQLKSDFLGVAVAERPEGPYKIMDKPCILNHGKRPPGYIEDMYPFVQNDKVYMMITDNFGKVSGIYGGSLMFESSDGLSFDYDKATLAVKMIPDYYQDYSPTKAKRFYGPADNPKFEAPRFLLINGKPAYFFGTSGFNVNGGAYPMTYVLKILE